MRFWMTSFTEGGVMNASLGATDSWSFASATLRSVSGSPLIVPRLPTKSVLGSDWSEIIAMSLPTQDSRSFYGWRHHLRSFNSWLSEARSVKP
jgi:hypothetical protein